MSDTTINLFDYFKKCVSIKLLKDGTTRVNCKLGLWSVSGRDREYVIKNAMNYWFQYFHDDEYDKLLKDIREKKQ